MEQNSSSKSLIIGAFALGVIVAFIGLYLTPLRHVQILPPEPAKFIKPAEFYADFQRNPDSYVFLDIRPEFLRFEYPDNVVNKSIFRLSEEAKDLPKTGKTIVIFCEEGISSRVAYGFLQSQGFTNLVIIEDGREGWKKAGLPLTRNPNYNEEAKPFLYFFEEGGLLPKSN